MRAPTGPRVFVVTGCASGIGRSLARRLHADGHSLLATDVNEEGLRKSAGADGWAGSDRAVVRALDVRDPRAWRDALHAAVERWGRLDVLV
ncbi:MAG: SDR family oxidoreductase, partial [Polyangiaceae bacterium]